jgi:uncharacterized membrane protein
MSDANPNARLETFCDGVFAIALTLLIIDIRIPAAAVIRNTREFWIALRHLAPSLFAFFLSFAVILITWVNHHGYFKLLDKSSPSFIYANGFLLLTVVLMPFPTALLGEYVFTDHAAPAVVLYELVIVIQSVAWVITSGVALKNGLTRSDRSAQLMRENYRNGVLATAVYSLMAAAGFWLPLSVAFVTTLTWAFWLYFGIRAKAE